MSSTKIEFAVQMTCESCVESVKKSLENVPGIKNVSVNLQTGSVVVDTSLPSYDVQKMIESTGRKTVIKGAAGTTGTSAAVAVIECGDSSVRGVVRFMQTNKDTCVIDGTIDGLNPGENELTIHECGDLSQGCKSVGDVYQPDSYTSSNNRLYGALGTVMAEKNGRAEFRKEDNVIKVSDLIGRSLVVTSKGYSDPTGLKQACGIIARSSGLFQNPKTVCACDGVSIWDERAVPKRI